MGPSWPSDLPHYSLLPGDLGLKAPVSGFHFQAERELKFQELNGGSGLTALHSSSRGSSAPRDCRKWVERTNEVMQGTRLKCFTQSK